MTSVKLPIDYHSITFSQMQLDEYFSEVSSSKKLVIIQKFGTELLELRDAGDFSTWEVARAFFGFGPACFKNVMKFCADRCLSHERLPLMVQTYNQQHWGHKQVGSVVERVLQEAVVQPQLLALAGEDLPPGIASSKEITMVMVRMIMARAALCQNMEVLKALENREWQDVRSLFIDGRNKTRELIFKIFDPEQSHSQIIDVFMKLIDKAPREDRNIIHAGKDEHGRTIFFLCALQIVSLSDKVLNSMKSGINQQDKEGKTPVMYLFDDRYSALQLQALLNLKPELRLKDSQGWNVLFYSCRSYFEDLTNQKSTMLKNAIKRLPEVARKQILEGFFNYRDKDGHSQLQRFAREPRWRPELMISMRQEFDCEDDHWTKQRISDDWRQFC